MTSIVLKTSILFDKYHTQHDSAVASLFAKCIPIEMIMWDLSFKMYLWWIFHVVTFPQLICMHGGWWWKSLICWELHPSLKHYKALGHQQPARLLHSHSLVSLRLPVAYVVRHSIRNPIVEIRWSYLLYWWDGIFILNQSPGFWILSLKPYHYNQTATSESGFI